MGQRTEIATGRAPGFTLLELVVTLFVLALAAALAVPLIGRSAETIRARADVAAFSAFLRHAREQAITTRQRRSVVVDPADHRLTIAGDGAAEEARTLAARVRIEADPPPALTVDFEPNGTSNGGAFRVVSGPARYRVTIDPVTGRVRASKE
jgi:general secretion pathway protein H